MPSMVGGACGDARCRRWSAPPGGSSRRRRWATPGSRARRQWAAPGSSARSRWAAPGSLSPAPGRGSSPSVAPVEHDRPPAHAATARRRASPLAPHQARRRARDEAPASGCAPGSGG
jgi:hypothetical protein